MSLASNLKRLTFNLGIWLVIAGMCLVMLQFYEYFRHGSRSFLSLAQALEWMEIPLHSLPAYWYQAYNVVRQTPLSIALMGLGAVLIWQST